MLIAHRGLFDNKKILENTIKAFDNAFKNNYDGIELDVRLTKDNIPIVIHDSFLSRVFKVSGRVKDYTYEELTKHEKRIPKLETIIKRYKDKIIFIELKEKIDIIKYLDNNNNYYISSFNYDYIKDIPKSNKYKLGIINYILNSNVNYDRLDFVMILESIYNDKLFKFNKLEIVIYGVIGNINNYNKDLKYLI